MKSSSILTELIHGSERSNIFDLSKDNIFLNFNLLKPDKYEIDKEILASVIKVFWCIQMLCYF